jgi:hypothetical protein
MESVERYSPVDSFFGKPYVDVDEEREQPLPHRYLHGGFEGTDTRFSFYLPPREQYEGRMVQTFGGASGGNEMSAQNVGMLNAHHIAFSNGAYLIESNQGHIGPSMEGLNGDMSILCGRADVETARLSHAVAEEIYGARPHHSYCYGGSGGGNFTIWAMERAPDLYDGGVPFMFGGSSFSMTLNAVRVLDPVIESVIDAMAAGGSGNPFEGLSTLQREALAALYRGGFQKGAEHQLRLPMPEIGWPGMRGVDAMRLADPGYFEAFWTEPGYAGADGVLETEIIHEKTTVSSVVTAEDLASANKDGAVAGGAMMSMLLQMLGLSGGVPLGIRVAGLDAGTLTGVKVTVDEGSAAGREWYCFMVVGDVLIPTGEGSFFDPDLVADITQGDAITVDNRDFLAYCYSDRHEARDPLSFAQFTVVGTPIYPQRPEVPSHLAWTGVFGGKMILQQHLMDRPCWPPVAIRYHRSVLEHFGDRTDDQFRIWWTDKAQHVPPAPGTPDATLSIWYVGIVSQGVRDVIAWAEDGTPPARTMDYEYVDGQVLLPSVADDRGGIQPVVSATANGAAAANVAAGENVELAFTAEVPTGWGTVIGAEWDFDGSGTFASPIEGIDGRERIVQRLVSHRFDVPGTHFATVRVTSHRDGDVSARTERIENLARVRIVVA